MDTTSKLLTAVGLALALVVGVGVYLAVNSAQAAAPNAASVVVAARDVPERTLFTGANVPELLTTRQLPADAVPAGAARVASEVIGRTTLQALLPGEVVINLPSRLASGEGAGARAAAAIPRDKVALAISTSETMSVGGALQPGDHVDVIATWSGPNNLALAQTVFPDVQVFAVGRRLAELQPRPVGAGLAAAPPAPEAPSTVTLLLDPQQAVTTQYLLQNGGSIALALRRFDQAGDLPTEPVTADSLTRRVLTSAPELGASAVGP